MNECNSKIIHDIRSSLAVVRSLSASMFKFTTGVTEEMKQLNNSVDQRKLDMYMRSMSIITEELDAIGDLITRLSDRMSELGDSITK